MKDIIKDLVDRGLLDSFSDKENVSKMLQTKQTIYCGFDPSAESLQLGNYVMITILRRLQKAGHRIIALIGGGTGMIGDPSGKKAERSFLTNERVNHNVECLKEQLSLYLDFSDPEKGLLLNNGDWWSKIPVIEYLREYGKAFSINYMLGKDVIASRMETGISYTEFSYMILQSADFYRLYKEYGCALQIGGGDQWGNLTSSLELIRKKENDANAEVFSVKLITDSEGRKFGKSERGALYLNPNMCSSYYIYQYFINVSDSDFARYMRIFDDRDLEEIQKDIDEHNQSPEKRLGQKKLAYLIVSQLHSSSVADDCIKMSEALFNNEFSDLKESQILEVAEGITNYQAEEAEINILDALIKVDLAKSRREAREFVSNGSVRLNGEKIEDIDYIVKNGNGLYGNMFFIRRGKKSYAFLKF
jgi:tyrosyl-tRNA synthetase